MDSIHHITLAGFDMTPFLLKTAFTVQETVLAIRSVFVDKK